MKELEIKGLSSQNKTEALKETLEHLNKALSSIYKANPTMKEIEDFPDYYNHWFDAEYNCRLTVSNVSDSIGSLIANDLTDKYLKV